MSIESMAYHRIRDRRAECPCNLAQAMLSTALRLLYLRQTMDTHAKGDCGELLVLAHLIQMDAKVAIPFGNQSGWDLLVEHADGWKRYQVKVARKRNQSSRPTIDCRRSMRRNGSRRTYAKGDFDFMVAVDIESVSFWRFPYQQISNRCSIALMPESQWKTL